MKDIISILVATWYIWVFIILLYLFNLVRPKIRGFFGEKSVALFLSRLDPVKYKVINNVMLKEDGKTVQIDHIVVSNYGIFVIETKNYKGWIIGDEYSEYWTQVIFKHKEKLYNPIRQNYGHIQALKTYLSEFPNIPLIPIIAFTTRADLKVTVSTDVVYTVNILKTIRKHSAEYISDAVKDQIVSKLTADNIVDKVERKKHVKDIHMKLDEAEKKIRDGICPKCGGNLVLRNGSRGRFKGCSNYPRCKFTSNV